MNNQVISKSAPKDASDSLRAIFTVWLKTTSLRKKNSTITRYYNRSVTTVTLDELHEKEIPSYFDLRDPYVKSYADLFQFTNVRLEKAFKALPDRYQQVLVYYFVYEMKTSDITKHLMLTRDVLYKIKGRALRKLRKELTNGKEANR